MGTQYLSQSSELYEVAQALFKTKLVLVKNMEALS